MAMNRINLASAFTPPDAATMATDAQAVAKGDQDVSKGAIALKELQRQTEQHNLIRNLVQTHTVIDPATGQAATDQKAVLRDAYLKDPEAAEQYQKHVEDMQTERTQSALKEEQDKQALSDLHGEAVGKALAAVDETGDQEQAKNDYAGAIQSLKAQGVPLQAGDEVYSPGRVAYWKRKLVGPTEAFKADSAEKLQTSKNEAAAKKVEAETERAIAVAKQRGADAKEVAGIRNSGTIAAAKIRAGATVQAATIRGQGVGGDDADDEDTIDYLADLYHRTGTLPAMGQGNAKLKFRVQKRVRQKYGVNAAADVAGAAANYKADTKSLGNQTTQADNLEGNITAMTDNLNNFLSLSGKIPNQSKNPVINSIKMGYRDKWKGDPDVRAMLAAHGTALREYAKVTSGNPSGAGVLSDSARHEALDTISGAAPMPQKIAAAKLIIQDAKNVVAAKRAQAAKASSRATGPSSAPPGVARVVRMSGVLYNQMMDGSLVKVKK
jgi:hypothetical protein